MNSFHILSSINSSLLKFGTPIILAGMGGVITENAGVVNIALEGIMRIGGLFVVFGSFLTGNPWYVLLLGLITGALVG